MNTRWSLPRAPAAVVVVSATWLLYNSVLEFYNMAWGTGHWLGQYSLKWALAFALFSALSILCLVLVGITASGRVKSTRARRWATGVRASLGHLRWLLAAAALVFPVWLFQYSPWGVAIERTPLRLLAWSVSSLLIAFLATHARDRVWTWASLLAGTLLSGAAFVLVAPFGSVTGYPFSLGWSEGNRLWDYSLLYGMRLYSYSSAQPPRAYLDIGRQLLGGLPFALPHVSILGERAWVATLETLPYVMLSVLAFWPRRGSRDRTWIFPAIWGFMFLSQGPIHAPLLFSAMLVALAWRQENWLAALLVAISSFCAETSRFTWMFAPAMWAVMLELGAAQHPSGRTAPSTWRRAAIVAAAGLLGSAVGIATGMLSGNAGLGTATAASTNQSLLWYRLLPNATYGNGILLGLLLAAGLPAALVVYLGARYWKPMLVQRLAIVLPLAAFLMVGLVVSTKIGGGGDLHNMDMFLIGLMFAAALEWRAVGRSWMADLGRATAWMSMALLVLIALPAFGPLMQLRPLSFARDADWLAVLADVQRPRDLGSLPADDVVLGSLDSLRESIRKAQAAGAILFMDQRQLLTFGYLSHVPLLGDYEKKRMMDEALSGNAAYFGPFYKDLAAHRFSLIISSPLRTPIRDSDYGFGEENNAWVRWVAMPTLCYYEELDTLTEVKVELLVPRTTPVECSTPLP